MHISGVIYETYDSSLGNRMCMSGPQGPTASPEQHQRGNSTSSAYAIGNNLTYFNVNQPSSKIAIQITCIRNRETARRVLSSNRDL